MFEEYILPDKVRCSKIASDIARRKLKREDIELLVKDPRVQKEFREENFTEKKLPQAWNKEYLEELALFATSGESFNRDYLLYLDEVAEYVSKAVFKKVAVAGVIIVLVIIAGVLVYKYVLGSPSEKAGAGAVNAIAVASGAAKGTVSVIGGTL